MSSVIAGTPGFMPPEELFNRPLTKASDLYSVGATAIALMTNTPASQLSNLIDDNYQFQFRHLLIGINPDFVRWLNKMVAPNLQDRFANAQTALAELKSIDITGISTAKPAEKKNSMTAIAVVGGAMLMILFSIVGIVREFTTVDKPPSPNKSSIPPTSTPKPPQSSLTSEQQWFRNIKSRCNSVEVVTAMRNTSYPNTPQGVGYAASCYALAGRLDLADRVIQELAPNLRGYAAGVVFNIGHPVADAGDDKSAGPIMDLVIRYWPENYMALYHAGMSAYVLDDYPKAKTHLQAFLRIYQRQDGWTNRAKSALTRMEQGIAADESFSIHH